MNSLGQRREHRNPNYYIDKLGRVVSNANYSKGTIEVSFIDHGKSMPVWVVGDINRKPEEGDMVIIGYIEGRKDAPYVKGFVKLESVTANYIEVGKDYIRFQLPNNERDKEEKMTDGTLKNSRTYIELNANGIAINQPEGDLFMNTPKGNIKYITKTGTGQL